MRRKELIILLALNLVIAAGFFLENRGTGFTELSSDMHNSVPVCYKFDDPTLFKGDLYLDSINNVRYYTPFYIQSVRFFAFLAQGDYLVGINIFATLLHLIFGLSWFALFFKVFRNFIIALLLSVLIRGIVWLPGFEIWGISDLWSIMPRTVYAVFMPIPFLLLLYVKRLPFLAACFLIGLLFNLHPITGLGGILMFVVFLTAVCWFEKISIPTSTLTIGLAFMLIGMAPFFSTYFTQTDSAVTYDIDQYQAAFFARLPDLFTTPATYLRLWLKSNMLFFFAPMIILLIYALGWNHRYRRAAWILFILSFLTIALPTISVYIEQVINSLFDLNLRLSFQLIRAQKLAILPGFFAMGFLMQILIEKYSFFKRSFPYAVTAFLLLLMVSKEPVFKGVPFFEDDIATSIFPDFREIVKPLDRKVTDMDRMLTVIKESTPSDAVFYGPFVLRVGSKRSVVLDGKGASMLIESNPQALIEWHQQKTELAALSQMEKVRYLKEVKSVTHIVTLSPWGGNVELLHREGPLFLYKVK